MDRVKFIQSCIPKDGIGIEIGPLHNPICAKRDGWRTLVLDAFTTNKLKILYENDQNVDTSSIEEVDLLYKNSLLETIKAYADHFDYGIGGVSRSFNYIVSSHNFEHQPNPIQFLIDCEYCLDIDGVLVMAIPVSSRCFDCWLPLTTTGMALDRFLMKSPKPTIGATLDSLTTQAYLTNGQPPDDQTYNVSQIALNEISNFVHLNSSKTLYPENYVDAHVSRFNHFSFELFIKEITALGLIKSLKVEECALHGSEFIAKIRKTGPSEVEASDNVLTSAERTEITKNSVLFHANDVLKGSNNSTLNQEINDPINEKSSGNNEALNEELDHFIRLSQVQAQQLSRYQELQQRSHRMVLKLTNQLKESKSNEPISFRK